VFCDALLTLLFGISIDLFLNFLVLLAIVFARHCEVSTAACGLRHSSSRFYLGLGLMDSAQAHVASSEFPTPIAQMMHVCVAWPFRWVAAIESATALSVHAIG